MRHLISGEDCAIAGEATAATAAPVAETFKKSRRFIKASPCWGRFPDFLEPLFRRRGFRVNRRRSGGALTRKLGWRKRDEGMTVLFKRKSHSPGSGRGDDALQLIADLGTDRPVDRRVRSVRLTLHDGGPGIRGGANRHVQRNFAQKRHGQPLGLVPRSAVAEDVRSVAALRAREIG